MGLTLFIALLVMNAIFVYIVQSDSRYKNSFCDKFCSAAVCICICQYSVTLNLHLQLYFLVVMGIFNTLFNTIMPGCIISR